MGPAAGGMLFMLIFLLFYLAIVILLIVSIWRVYEKAGEAGWKCLIPFYSTYVMLRFTGRPTKWMWYIFLPMLFYMPAYFLLLLDMQGAIYMAPMVVVALILLMLSMITVMMVFNILIYTALCDRFGISKWFTLGLVLMPIIFWPILAFGDYTYTAPVKAADNDTAKPSAPANKPEAAEEDVVSDADASKITSSEDEDGDED